MRISHKQLVGLRAATALCLSVLVAGCAVQVNRPLTSASLDGFSGDYEVLEQYPADTFKLKEINIRLTRDVNETATAVVRFRNGDAKRDLAYMYCTNPRGADKSGENSGTDAMRCKEGSVLTPTLSIVRRLDSQPLKINTGGVIGPPQWLTSDAEYLVQLEFGRTGTMSYFVRRTSGAPVRTLRADQMTAESVQ
ncbi:hypothetical protein [Pandoraea sputorum]|uniref:hypothetical protein n=1 Tax=Pandoraea sputorum TaxID=93222 RepID=UPI001241B70A|nr:hypothetical protein [Pandoraea sputorum]VVE76380.1 hypothetical protein PSP31120_00741 [Pandoraea sputorum]